jgi:hypothetical protein
MKTLKKYTVSMPDYALPYLINNDIQGLSEDDISMIEKALRPYYSEARALHGVIDFSCDLGDSYFTWHPFCGLACTCVDFDILIFEL